ncbi:PEP motif putative anchor domain protein (plasmid) [Gemmatirosa kalamazoonensis]|uniref:PEP motif putative anchor domain protein n=1 Tax=Gemmatirosa kalamazoonensis TaxID=861299 RepID=W0RR35_9BACT|nr:PEP-CTERM sorting domain-containing protein [Gemmatirosa kalamazoonensis]AHG92765.1 PEP motif putative anchor domain protein [Gemmatirosa kalamazoonensis]
MRRLVSLLAAALLLAARSTHAQDVTFGGSVDGTIGSPFTFYNSPMPNRYQQMYVGSQFPQPVWIDAVRFQNTRAVSYGTAGPIAPGNYLVRFAITDRAENGLTADFDANVTGYSATFFSGAIVGNTLRIAGAPYLFDPSRGNLLLDVTVLSQDYVSYYGFDFSRSTTDGTSRVYNSSALPGVPSTVRTDALGLITTFETRPYVTTPEPATLALLAGGVGLLVVVARRRRV